MLYNYCKCFDKQNIIYASNIFDNLQLLQMFCGQMIMMSYIEIPTNDYDVISWNTDDWLWCHMLE
jgi:hypothetical protein